MKHAILVFILSAFIIVLPSCRKCYTCQNVCYTCSKLDTAGGTLSVTTFCSDTSNYKTLKSKLLSDSSYTCSLAKATYHDDFCVNTSDGTNQYLLYHEGNGKFTCTQK